MNCLDCGSGDTEVYEGEYPGEPDVLHCYDCGADEEL